MELLGPRHDRRVSTLGEVRGTFNSNNGQPLRNETNIRIFARYSFNGTITPMG